ncbi:hypothetical protein [Parvibaculum sp.]|uniref:hypothetical protein n=1 Tax=Parvibaculum sp. TaxID=2024848 RepID=UPI0029C46089|nr:hypothetical protein [Alphaproteobacteria bacterium]
MTTKTESSSFVTGAFFIAAILLSAPAFADMGAEHGTDGASGSHGMSQQDDMGAEDHMRMMNDHAQMPCCDEKTQMPMRADEDRTPPKSNYNKK